MLRISRLHSATGWPSESSIDRSNSCLLTESFSVSFSKPPAGVALIRAVDQPAFLRIDDRSPHRIFNRRDPERISQLRCPREVVFRVDVSTEGISVDFRTFEIFVIRIEILQAGQRRTRSNCIDTNPFAMPVRPSVTVRWVTRCPNALPMQHNCDTTTIAFKAKQLRLRNFTDHLIDVDIGTY